MKKLLLLSSVLLLSLSGFAQLGAWVSQSTGFTAVPTGIREIIPIDTNIVWATSEDGSGNMAPHQDYSRTIDGGAHWVVGVVPAGADWDWSGLYARRDSLAWAIFYSTVFGGSGEIWHTTNAGTTWTRQDTSATQYAIYKNHTSSFPNNIYFWNDTLGVVVGDPLNGVYEIYTTTNGGLHWDSVPSANIPAPFDANETGYTSHYTVVGDTIWWDSNEGRVFRSVDHGHHWTVSNPNLPIPSPPSNTNAIDICFYDAMHGLARYYDGTVASNTVVASHDGGTTWDTLTVFGNLYGADYKHVPGTARTLISTGAATSPSFLGSSYSADGGVNWTNIESNGVQRGSLGIIDSLHMWCGGFTTSPTADGIFKWNSIHPILCTDTSINAGVTTVSDTALCGEDTLTATSSGIYSPLNGDYSGISWVVTTADITGSANPLQEPSLVLTYTITFPPASTDFRLFINDGTLIDGSTVPYGVYYWTPVVFANATALNSPVTFLSDLTLDNACTFTGTSLPVDILDPANCSLSGVKNITANRLSVTSSIQDRNVLNVLINSNTSGKAVLQLMDLTGRILNNINTTINSGSNHELIDISNLASGTYLIKAEINGGRAVNKVVKY